MLAIAAVHPSKKVVVADWDSEEEGKRSARGIEFRRRLKEDSQEKKMAAQEARHAADLDLAERVYEALILATNQGPLDTLARDPKALFFDEYFEDFYRDLVASKLGHNVPNRNNRGGTPVMLNRISRSHITSQQIQQHTRLVRRLVTIGSNPDFRDGFLVRREGHVSSEDEAVGAAQAQAQAPARAGRRRRRREEDQQAARRVLRRG